MLRRGLLGTIGLLTHDSLSMGGDAYVLIKIER